MFYKEYVSPFHMTGVLFQIMKLVLDPIECLLLGTIQAAFWHYTDDLYFL